MQPEPLLDPTGWKILRLLEQDARLTFAEVGRRVGLSAPAVAERVRRMEESGLITGYRAVVDLSRLGPVVTAFIRMEVPPPSFVGACELARSLPEVVECHAVTGEETFLVKVVAPGLEHVDRVLSRLCAYGATRTAMVLSTRLTPRPPDLRLFGARGVGGGRPGTERA